VIGAIGGTASVRLRRVVPAGCADVWVKLELQNPTGSMKDRLALAMVRAAERSGQLDGSTALLECTGGSTGTSLAFVASALGYRCSIISSDAYAPAKLASMRALGATLFVEPSVGGQVTPDLWPRMRARAETLVAAGGAHWVDQFQNTAGLTGYRDLGQELVDQVPTRVDAFCAAVGTAGLIMGAGRAIREACPDARIVALEPDTSAVLSGGAAGSHTIDGTAAGFVPPLFDRAFVTEVMALSEASARAMARALAEREGLFAGTSTGLNVLGALRLAREIGPGGTVVTVACDSGFKYLDGTLFASPSSGGPPGC